MIRPNRSSTRPRHPEQLVRHRAHQSGQLLRLEELRTELRVRRGDRLTVRRDLEGNPAETLSPARLLRVVERGQPDTVFAQVSTLARGQMMLAEIGEHFLGERPRDEETPVATAPFRPCGGDDAPGPARQSRSASGTPPSSARTGTCRVSRPAVPGGLRLDHPCRHAVCGVRVLGRPAIGGARPAHVRHSAMLLPLSASAGLAVIFRASGLRCLHGPGETRAERQQILAWVGRMGRRGERAGERGGALLVRGEAGAGEAERRVVLGEVGRETGRGARGPGERSVAAISTTPFLIPEAAVTPHVTRRSNGRHDQPGGHRHGDL